MRSGAPLPALAFAIAVAGCGPLPTRQDGGDKPRVVAPQTNAGRYAMDKDVAPAPAEVPPDVASTPDAVPRAEPRSAGGNSRVYEVFGKTYRVLDKASGFRERGHASWYGKKFHGHRTANGETYDMYKMTAAHKSLPIPSYVRVTRLDSGKSVVVRVNDRGPFHKGRIIDLSYAAAAKLDMLRAGSVAVEIVALDPLEPAPAGEGWLQVAEYADPINAVVLREELAAHGQGDAQILVGDADGLAVHRVVLGPFADTAAAESRLAALQALGYSVRWMKQ